MASGTQFRYTVQDFVVKLIELEAQGPCEYTVDRSFNSYSLSLWGETGPMQHIFVNFYPFAPLKTILNEAIFHTPKSCE